MKTGGRLVKDARCYRLLLAESHLTRWLFGGVLEKVVLLPRSGAKSRCGAERISVAGRTEGEFSQEAKEKTACPGVTWPPGAAQTPRGRPGRPGRPVWTNPGVGPCKRSLFNLFNPYGSPKSGSHNGNPRMKRLRMLANKPESSPFHRSDGASRRPGGMPSRHWVKVM